MSLPSTAASGSPGAAAPGAGFIAADPCVHCGFCLPTCASYRVLATEMDSPRGRIHALKAIDAGELALDATVAKHFDSCLGCFACVTACPAGVRYDQLIETMRPRLNAPELRSPAQRAFRRLIFALLPYPGRLRALLAPLRFYAGTPLQALARRSGLTRLFGPQIEALDSLLPPLAPEAFRDGLPVLVPARGERRYRVGLVLGCVQRLFDPAVNAAAIEVLSANGIEVVIPPDQGCCGAVTHHQGELEQTCELATDLMERFEAVIGPGKAAGPEPLDAILVAASGCGHTLKHYGDILPAASGPAAFAARVADIQEFLDRVGPSEDFRAGLKPLNHADGTPATAERPLRLAYHDACHMLHGQGLREQPRSLLRHIPHVLIVEATEAGVCCGSAGIYNLVQPVEAAELGRIKAADLAATGAELAVSANIGCTLQIRRHMEDDARPIRVMHPVELLAASFHQETSATPLVRAVP
ncbi:MULTISPECIES: (Fe-S)-binding protein [unclassified Cyanobium]|uniref:(Fe-S)-binding protein n=1 Tax=unclassified Cyanobium TaxID=2627006 RepID=UPI0020CC4A14|nr:MULTISPECIES: (Fe-S)-binding protein [unclassified Cyanobium]MCP9860324.1 (Fe-S)-binding protein [Cyanobium sp. Cruz-8H5]MCP9867591.1 (Fe-S)-binding protein [Cyanobium sp. Cruz-8D1]